MECPNSENTLSTTEYKTQGFLNGNISDGVELIAVQCRSQGHTA